jgi:hypothetical protein
MKHSEQRVIRVGCQLCRLRLIHGSREIKEPAGDNRSENNGSLVVGELHDVIKLSLVWIFARI